jgi:hypothetical protein
LTDNLAHLIDFDWIALILKKTFKIIQHYINDFKHIKSSEKQHTTTIKKWIDSELLIMIMEKLLIHHRELHHANGKITIIWNCIS